MKKKITGVFLAAVVTACTASGATLSGPSQTVHPGGAVTVVLSLASGTDVTTGVQFDLAWDAALDVNVAPGAQAGIADKVLYTSVQQPGVLRCLIAGLNQSALADGELVILNISVGAGASAGTSQVTVLNAVATGAGGESVPLQGGSVAVQIQGGLIQGIELTGVLNGASLTPGPVSPGEIITLVGSFLAGSPDILFNGVPAIVTYSGPSQVNAIVPFGLNASNPAQVQIQQNGVGLQTTIPVAAAAPAIFTLNTSGIGPGAILNQDYSVNSVSKPAAAGSVIMIYGTGFGALNPLPADGQIARTLALTGSPVTASIDGVPALVWYAGAAPTLINGVVQVNVQVPQGAHTNPAAPLKLVMGSFATPPGVTVAIQ